MGTFSMLIKPKLKQPLQVDILGNVNVGSSYTETSDWSKSSPDPNIAENKTIYQIKLFLIPG